MQIISDVDTMSRKTFLKNSLKIDLKNCHQFRKIWNKDGSPESFLFLKKIPENADQVDGENRPKG